MSRKTIAPAECITPREDEACRTLCAAILGVSEGMEWGVDDDWGGVWTVTVRCIRSGSRKRVKRARLSRSRKERGSRRG